MLETTFIAVLNGIEINEDLGRGDKLDSETFITNEFNHIAALLTPDWVQHIGLIEATALHDGKVWIYGNYQRDIKDGETGEFQTERMFFVQQLLSNLWLLKDNAVNIETGHMRTCFPDRPPRFGKSHFNSAFTKAGGRPSPLGVDVFTRGELREARTLLRVFQPIESDDDSFLIKRNKEARTERADYMIHQARTTDDIAMRIALNVTAMETLFTTSSHELAHQLSERMALFLGKTPKERHDIYCWLKKAYNIRSSVVHGGVIDETFKVKSDGVEIRKDLPEMSELCDSYLRRSLHRIYMEYNGSLPSDLDKHFLDMILGLRDTNSQSIVAEDDHADS